MKQQISILSAVISGLLVSASSTNANLLMNGSFENGSFNPNRDAGTMQLFDGSTAITGWVVMGGGGGIAGDIAWENSANPWLFRASEGDKFLDLTGYINDPNTPHGGIALSQTVNVTIGTSYWLSFDVGSSRTYSDGVNPQVTVTVNGTPTTYVFTGDVSLPDGPGPAQNHWQRAGFGFVASENQAVISFLATTPGYDRVIQLDNVNLSAVPEPATMFAGVLLLLPFGASAIRILRRRP